MPVPKSIFIKNIKGKPNPLTNAPSTFSWENQEETKVKRNRYTMQEGVQQGKKDGYQ